jgi:hypothetical protein
MKKRRIVWAVFVWTALGMAASRGDFPQIKWKGTITEKDGVATFENPKRPLYAGPVLKLTEELRIGEAEGQPEYAFGRIAAIAVDDKGCLYVADDKNIHVKAFDPKGGYLRTIGRKGQGPGEIGSPYDLFINSRGELMVSDGKNYKLHFYSSLGASLRDKSFGSRFPQHTAFGPKDQLYVLSFGGDFDTGKYFELAKLNEDLTPAAVLHKVVIPPGPLKESLGDKVPLFCIRSDGNLVMGFAKPDEYRIKIIDPNGRLSRIISRDFDRVPIPKDVLEKAKQSLPPDITIEMPTHYAAYSRLIADDEGKIFALTSPTYPESKLYSWDLFDVEGRYLAVVRLPGSAWHLANMKNGLLWKKGKLYVVEEDEDGYHLIKRYAAAWTWK